MTEKNNKNKKPFNEAHNDKLEVTAENACANCIHFMANPKNISIGVCRRFPPSLVMTPAQDQEGKLLVTQQGQLVHQPTAHFPLVAAQVVCGEHKERATRH